MTINELFLAIEDKKQDEYWDIVQYFSTNFQVKDGDISRSDDKNKISGIAKNTKNGNLANEQMSRFMNTLSLFKTKLSSNEISNEYKTILLINFFNSLAHYLEAQKDTKSQWAYEIKAKLILDFIKVFGKKNVIYQKSNFGDKVVIYVPIDLAGNIEVLSWHIPASLVKKVRFSKNSELVQITGMSREDEVRILEQNKDESNGLSNNTQIRFLDNIVGNREELKGYPIKTVEEYKLEPNKVLTDEQKKVVDIFNKINLELDIDELNEKIRFFDYSELNGIVDESNFNFIKNGAKDEDDKLIYIISLLGVLDKILNIPQYTSNDLIIIYNKLLNNLSGLGSKLITREGQFLLLGMNNEDHKLMRTWTVDYKLKISDFMKIKIYNRFFQAAEDIACYKNRREYYTVEDNNGKETKIYFYEIKLYNELENMKAIEKYEEGFYNINELQEKIVQILQNIDLENFDISMLNGVLPDEIIKSINEYDDKQLKIIFLASFIDDVMKKFVASAKGRKGLENIYAKVIDKIKYAGTVVEEKGKGNTVPQLIVKIDKNSNDKVIKLPYFNYKGKVKGKNDIVGLSFRELCREVLTLKMGKGNKGVEKTVAPNMIYNVNNKDELIRTIQSVTSNEILEEVIKQARNYMEITDSKILKLIGGSSIFYVAINIEKEKLVIRCNEAFKYERYRFYNNSYKKEEIMQYGKLIEGKKQEVVENSVEEKEVQEVEGNESDKEIDSLGIELDENNLISSSQNEIIIGRETLEGEGELENKVTAEKIIDEEFPIRLKNTICNCLSDDKLKKSAANIGKKIKSTNFEQYQYKLDSGIYNLLILAKSAEFADENLRLIFMTSAIAEILKSPELSSRPLENLYAKLIKKMAEYGNKFNDEMVIYIDDYANVMNAKTLEIEDIRYNIRLPLSNPKVELKKADNIEGENLYEVQELLEFLKGKSKIEDTFEGGGSYDEEQPIEESVEGESIENSSIEVSNQGEEILIGESSSDVVGEMVGKITMEERTDTCLKVNHVNKMSKELSPAEMYEHILFCLETMLPEEKFKLLKTQLEKMSPADEYKFLLDMLGKFTPERRNSQVDKVPEEGGQER